MSIIQNPTAVNHRHSSKRKLGDDGNSLNLVSVKMKKHVEAKSLTVSESSGLQFFVRMLPKGNSVMMIGFKDETVKSVLQRIEGITGIPVSEQRLIYGGKQLQQEQSLEECGIKKDSNLHLVGHLRSGGCPATWTIMEEMVSLIGYMCRGETVCDTARINVLMTRLVNIPGFLDVFVSYRAPALLVTLYVSPYAGNKNHADVCIRHFLSCCRSSSSKELLGNFTGVVLEFCKLFRRIRCDDPLYMSCRSTFAFLLDKIGVSHGTGNAKPRVLLHDIFPFVRELADSLLKGLTSGKNKHTSSQSSLVGDVCDFIAFLTPLRNRVRKMLGLEGSLTDGKSHEEDDPLLAEEVDYLRLMFIRLLCKMHECFSGMMDCLASKEPVGEGNHRHPEWSMYLNILKELYQVSKLYDDAEKIFWKVLKYYRAMVSELIVRFAKRSDKHEWILENKSVTTFESRRHLVMMLFPEVKEDYEQFHEMLIDRSQLLTESFEYINRAKPQSLRAGLLMEFKNEDATGPGVLREWFVLVCHAIFNPQNALFVACPNDQRRFYPNPASKVHPLHLEYFSFSGRIIALALMKKVQVGIFLDRVFFMQLAGKCITLEDIRDADPYLYRSCKHILEMDADFIDSDALGLTFVREVEDLGYRKEVELCPGGKSIVVNSKNREKFVDRLIQNCFVTSISEQVSHFVKGFADILSNSKLQQFFQSLLLEDLDSMLHGSENTISVEDWKAHTKYNGYKETDRLIYWFWEIVGRMSAKQRKVLLFFWTSVKYLPVEGFRGMGTCLYICRTLEPNDRLPSSHTCFYQLCFPRYSSKSVMQDRLGVITREHIGCSFGAW